MRYWWLNHGQTHLRELAGGYTWSPKSNKGGISNPTYKNLTEVRTGDVIFSFSDKAIRAIGIATDSYSEAVNPYFGLNAAEAWTAIGYRVPIAWTVLRTPFEPRPHIALLWPLLLGFRPPLNPDGNGAQHNFLSAVSRELFDAVIMLMGLEDAESVVPFLETQEEQKVLNSPDLTTSRKQGLIQARRGQGLFKNRVTKLEASCRVSGTKDARVLIASHIKPWAVSDNRERLDGNNGLLLAPHVDRLFDRFLISFQDDGRIITAGPAINKLMQQWGLNPELQTPCLKAGQLPYMKYHRGRLQGTAQKNLWT